jgi:hypothetical protein
VAAFCQLPLGQLGLKTKTSAQRWRELSTCCAAVMPRISFYWQYTLSTPSAEGVGRVSKSTLAMTTFWLALMNVGRSTPSRLMVVVVSLA